MDKIIKVRHHRFCWVGIFGDLFDHIIPFGQQYHYCLRSRIERYRLVIQRIFITDIRVLPQFSVFKFHPQFGFFKGKESTRIRRRGEQFTKTAQLQGDERVVADIKITTDDFLNYLLLCRADCSPQHFRANRYDG